MMQVMQWLTEAKHTVLAVSLRTHGDSTGQVNDIGWSARRDVVAAVRFLQNECPGCPVYIVGRSLGAAAAIFAAGELGDDIAGYFLEQPYQDLRSAVQNRLQHYLPPPMDSVAYAGMLLWAPVFLPADPDQISPYNRIEDIPVSVPVVLISGSADQHARIEEVELLYERVASHAKLLVVEDARHEPLDQKAPSFYRTALFDLIGI
jgi:alpha-beta hydrolase superfamily lysophospholipase